MLSNTDRKKIEICAYKIAHPDESMSVIGEHFSLHRNRVRAALKFGEQNGFFSEHAKKAILEEIRHVNKIISPLETTFTRLCKETTKKIRENKATEVVASQVVFQLTALSKQLLDLHTRTTELRGLYKKVLNLEVSGNLFADAVRKAYEDRQNESD